MSALTPPRAHIRRGRCVAVFHVREQGSPACSALPNGSRYIHMDTATLTGSKIPDQFRGLFTVGLTTLMSMLGDGIVTQPGGDYSLAALAPPPGCSPASALPKASTACSSPPFPAHHRSMSMVSSNRSKYHLLRSKPLRPRLPCNPPLPQTSSPPARSRPTRPPPDRLMLSAVPAGNFATRY